MSRLQRSVTFSAFEKCVLALTYKGSAGHVSSPSVEHVCVLSCAVQRGSFPTKPALWTQHVTFRGQPQ